MDDPGWHRREGVQVILPNYLAAMEAALRTREGRYFLRTRCRRCGILFLTFVSNRLREDLHCSFGCRKIREKKTSGERSLAYYQSEEGKEVKRRMNQKRYRLGLEKSCEMPRKGDDFLKYLKSVLEGIEGREFSLDEVKALRKGWLEKGRQRGLLSDKDLEDEGDG